MTHAIVAAQTIRDGGFHIEVGPADLVVEKDKSAWKSRRMSMGSIIGIAFFCLVGYVVLKRIDPNFFHFEDVPIVGVAVALGIVAFFVWPTGVNNIHATPDHLEVIRLMRGDEAGRWLFPRATVKMIRYVSVPTGTWLAQVLGSQTYTCAISFEVEGNNLSTLRGIEGPEALIVMRELQRLGFDVEIDVAMQIMRELVPARRGKLQP